MNDNDLIYPMVDNMINGIFSQVSKINTETLSPETRKFLKDFREDLKKRKSIDKELGNKIVKTLIKYHNDTGELIQPLLVEMITASFYAIEPYRKYSKYIAEFFMLSSIFTVLTITDNEDEIADLIEQTIIAILTNPIYEFTYHERKQLINLIAQTNGYLAVLNFYTRTFGKYLNLLDKVMQEGFSTGLELCNASKVEFEEIQNKNHLYRLKGMLKFLLNLGWPIMNLSKESILKSVEKRTGIRIWPVK